MLTIACLALQVVGSGIVFRSPRVVESSGVAVSRAHPGIVWTHNDSGDGPYIYATDFQGRDLGAVLVSGAGAIDWEDMALGPCPRGPKDCLFVGDVGDNFESRPWVTVYAVQEPEPPRSPGDTLRVTAAALALRLRYPDGPHDVETLYVGPTDGTLWLVSKGRSGPIRLYRVDRGAWGSDSTVTATLMQTVPIVPLARAGRWVTGGTIRHDGRVVVLRTLSQLYWFTTARDGRLDLKRSCLTGVPEYQGEAVDFVDDSTLVLTSEGHGRGRPGQINVTRCPTPHAEGRK